MKFIKLLIIAFILIVQIQNRSTKSTLGFKSHSKSPQLATKIFSKVDPNQAKLTLEQHTNSEFLSDDNKLDYDQKCLIKQGYLANILQFKVSDKSLQGQPVFAVLNSHNIALFENENVNSLVSTVELKEISQIIVPKVWVNNKHYCLQIKDGKFDKDKFFNDVLEQPINDARMTICGQSLIEMASWIQSFKDLLYYCQVPKKEIVTINQKIKQQRVQIDTKLQDYTSKQMEENEKLKQEDTLLKEKEKKKMESIKAKFTEIMKQQTEAKVKEQKQVTIIEEETRKIEEKTTSIQEQKECLEEALDTRRTEEIKISQALISQEEESSEVNLVQSAKTKIRIAQEKELKQITEQEEDLKKEALKKQNVIKKNIIGEIEDAERSLDPAVCYNPQLQTNSIATMKTACGQLIYPGSVPDIKKIERCMYKPNFCNECCQHFIGVNHGVARGNCKQKCRGLLFPETFEEHQYDYVFKIPTENQIKNKVLNQTNTDPKSNDKKSENLQLDNKNEKVVQQENEDRFIQKQQPQKNDEQKFQLKDDDTGRYV